MYNVKLADEEFIKTAAWLARDLNWDEEFKPYEEQVDNWRESVMKIIGQHQAAHREIKRLQEYEYMYKNLCD